MTDPAVEAAQQANADVDGYWNTTRDAMEAAAREALKPIRELHRKSPLYNLTDDCEVCSSDDDAIREQHDTFESAAGDWCCTAVIVAYCCAHCAEVQGYNGEDVREWPCETATYVYSAEELT